MSVAELSRERVAERLTGLQESYDSFPVDQTTLSVATEAYDKARERCRGGLVDAHVQVSNGDGDVLLVDRDGDWVVPRAEPGAGRRLETGAQQAVRERTGVECSVTGLRRVTILGVRDVDDPERPPVYRLVAVFTAEYVAGSPAEDSEWHADLPESALPGY